MSAPVDDPRFATSANYTADGDVWGGDPTKLDPGSGRKAEGFEPDSLPAEWLNWCLNLLGSWAYWLNLRGPQNLWFSHLSCVAGTVGDWVATPPNTYTESQVNTGVLRLDLSALPKNTSIKKVYVLVKPGASRAGANRISAVLGYTSISGLTTPVTFGGGSTTAAYDDGTTQVQMIVIDVSGSPKALATYPLIDLIVAAGNDGAANKDRLYGVFVETVDD